MLLPGKDPGSQRRPRRSQEAVARGGRTRLRPWIPETSRRFAIRSRLDPAFLWILTALLLLAGPARADLLLGAADPERLARFYRDELGFLPDPAFVGTPAAATVLLATTGERLILVPGSPPAETHLRLLLPADDLVAAQARLSAAGIDVVANRAASGEIQALLFADPEGNPLALIRPGNGDGLATWEAGIGRWLAAMPAGSGEDGGTAADSDRGRTASGRVELAIWSGLHGVGLGFALPYSLGSDSPTAIGLTMMAAGPAAAWAGHTYARRVGLTRGQTRALEYGGDFAMWQAFGWAGVADTEAKETLAWGTAGLVTGAVGTALLTRGRDISPGQAGVFLSSASWAAWFGLVGAQMADIRRDVTGDETLATLLLSSAAGGLAGGVAATAWDPRDSRLAWINLGGVLGTAFGFGLDLVLQVEDDAAVWAIPAATGLGSLVFTTWMTGRSPEGRGMSGRIGELGGGGDSSSSDIGGSHSGGDVVWLPPAAVRTGGDVRLELLRLRF